MRQNPPAQAPYATVAGLHAWAKVTLSTRRTTAFSTNAWTTHTSPVHTLPSWAYTAASLSSGARAGTLSP
ncbi:MAG: hypothetical protein N0E54_16415 [Candidatus Thiodiazotropha taylori]|nr:hypothetical protein [Candidatus Thiodiazotropha endolucinida]MCW4230326.1 hypothetical protein [Candidatus Thiodiazotropha taylori]